MALFLVINTDRPQSVDLRKAVRSEHLAWLQGVAEAVRIAGPLLDDDGEMCGSMLVVEADRKADVAALIAEDPYAKAGLFSSMQVNGWRWIVGVPA